jgi:calpain-7
MILSINPYSIKQQYVTDCSFIASLCICAAFQKRFGKRLITSIIYPQDKEGTPIYNPEGKYIIKLWLNGVARQVIVDDRLPIDRHSNLLCSQASGSRDQLELWVSIIEKAYMKLCGGYDFPGSNSGVDLFSLTGWIPERIFFAKDPRKIRDFETAPDRAWERLFSANSFGDCLITVSTTRDMTEAGAESLGLVTGHAYAVLDVFQARNGTRLLQLKNPWASKVRTLN